MKPFLILLGAGENGEQWLNQLDQEFYAYKDDLSRPLIEYVDKHKGDLGD